ncbi:MAG: transcription termination/antitermination protein NusG [bacterium]
MTDKKITLPTDILEEKEQAEDGEVTSEVVANNPYHVIYDPDEKAAEPAKWYVVHTYSGHELKVAAQLKIRLESMHVEKKVFEVVIPAQDKIQVRKGQKKTIKEKILPGYILIKMIMDDQSWLAVRTTPGVTAFIGSIGRKPTPIPLKEVDAIMKFMAVKAPKFKSTFSLGEAVKIVEGPFADFLGTVDHLDETKGKVHVLVSIFGRETPVELDYMQVSKI